MQALRTVFVRLDVGLAAVIAEDDCYRQLVADDALDTQTKV